MRTYFATIGVCLLACVPVAAFANSTSGSACITFSFNMRVGSTDARTQGEVSELQQFLGIASSTGYFGLLTEQAVQSWQFDNGIVATGTPAATGFGVVGPRTRASMACRDASISSSSPIPGGLQVYSASSASVGQTVTIEGSGFTSANSVQFGANVVGPIASDSDGTSISFVLPTYTSSCDPLATTSCTPLAVAVAPGVYPLSVHNASGASNSVSFTIRAPSSALTPSNASYSATPPFGILSVSTCESSSSALCDFTATWFTQNSGVNGSSHATIDVFTAAHYGASALLPNFSALSLVSSLPSPDYSFESPDANGIHVFELPEGAYEFVLLGYGANGAAVVLQKVSVEGASNTEATSQSTTSSAGMSP